MDYSKLQNGSDIRGVALEGIEGQHINFSLTNIFPSLSYTLISSTKDFNKSSRLVYRLHIFINQNSKYNCYYS